MSFSFFDAPFFPYLEAGPWQIGHYTVYMFGLMVWLGLLIATTIAIRRAILLFLDVHHFNRMLLWSGLTGLFTSHAFVIWIDYPNNEFFDLFKILDIFNGLSSAGVMLGFFLGMSVYVYRHNLDFFRYADAATWGGVHGWILARTGCAFAHDHPGKYTDAWFSVRWPLDHPDQRFNPASFLGRHDLGLYEMLLVLVILILLYMTNAQGQRFPGFTVALTFTVFAPARFLMDFLRVNDIRYAGLTPAQYVTVFMLLGGLAL
ncbi:MAG: prolipoprotein diacylglyceryl transferase, partial [Gammaproteobacteria bacterium]